MSLTKLISSTARSFGRYSTSGLLALVLAAGCGGAENNPAGSASSCSRDSDCKGERICVNNQCVANSPSESSSENNNPQNTEDTPDPRRNLTGEIVLTLKIEENTDIYRVNANGSNLVRITTDSGNDLEASWSPNGEKIAFTSNRNNEIAVYTMNSDGSSQIKLVNTLPQGSVNWNWTFQPSWSPDGREIVFSGYALNNHGEGESLLYIIDTQGGNLRVIPNVTYYMQPAWSSDGEKIAYVQNEGNDLLNIMTINTDGSNLQQLTTLGGFRPAWSPEGRKIAFSSTRDGKYNIYVMNVDGSNQTRLTSNDRDNYHSCWSPDGVMIAYSSKDNITGYSALEVMNDDGSNPFKIIDVSNNVGTHPSWKP